MIVFKGGVRLKVQTEVMHIINHSSLPSVHVFVNCIDIKTVEGNSGIVDVRAALDVYCHRKPIL
jgi:hypothetical protein